MPGDFSSLEDLNLSQYDDSCRSSVSHKFDHHKTMINAIFDTANEISEIKSNVYFCYKKQYKTETEYNNLIKQIQFSVGRLWILSGLCLLEIFSAISPVDPIQKVKVRIACSEDEVCV